MPRVVTIGGGHGQAVVLSALRILDCSISAVVATADDGGCSGELRRELGMPAPGDLRRCLSALALDEQLAAQLEDRLLTGSPVPRCRGNLVVWIGRRSALLAFTSNSAAAIQARVPCSLSRAARVHSVEGVPHPAH
jgi:hypothetical protein